MSVEHMPVHPREFKDLVLAPVAVEIDHNLQRVRGKSPEEIEALFPRPDFRDWPATSDGRAARVLDLALEMVDLRGWDATITEDHSAIRLFGGSVTLDISVSASVLRFIKGTDA